MSPITRTLLHLTMASILAAGACAPAGSAEPAAAPAPSASTPPASASPSTFEWATYTGPAGTRRYKLFVPAGYETSFPPPLVVMLHGCTQDPDDFARGTRFNALADSAGAIVVYPEQTAQLHPQKCWTWYEAANQRAESGEAAIIAGITREVMGRYTVDPARVYIGGVSAGGIMAVNTAASHPDLYAAVGVHSGTAYGAATDLPSALAAMRSGPANPDALVEPARAILRAAGRDWLPIIVFHGAADAVVNAENGRRLASQWAVAGGAKDFLRSEEEIGGLTVVKDRFGPATELWIVQGLGHAWSGGSPEGTYTDARGPDASREMLRFFLSHPRG
ncbi:MAG TPA: PHB depolymerase family esterase [Longimicrobium sp.]|nr:PHB depolymerase family esterase [Longimicrobium sp.]